MARTLIMTMFSALSNSCHISSNGSERRGSLSDRLLDIVLGEMTVMCFDHLCICVSKILRDDKQWGSCHDHETGAGVPQRVKISCGHNLGVLTGHLHRDRL